MWRHWATRERDLSFSNGAIGWRKRRCGRPEWQRFEMRLLLGEGLIDHALRGGVHARIGNRVEPMPQLGIEIVEIAERAGEEEVLADVAVGSLDFALGFGPVRTASLRLEAVVAGEVNESAIVDDATASLAHDCRLHWVIEDLLAGGLVPLLADSGPFLWLFP